MGRTRRKAGVLSVGNESEACVNCRETRSRQRNFTSLKALPERTTLYQYLQKSIDEKEEVRRRRQASECESETDSAIDTASTISSYDSNSLLETTDDLNVSSHSEPQKKTTERCVEISLNSVFIEQDYETELLEFTKYVTGVALQKFTKKDECWDCIQTCESLQQQYYEYLDLLAVNDSYVIDLTGIDAHLFIEEYSEMSFVKGDFLSKVHSYYVTPKGATYYIDIPRHEPQLLPLPRHLMIPPSERDAFESTHPPQRPWIPLSHPERNKPTALFTVMCYNVLCDKYCTRNLYGYTPSWALHWDYRKKGILEEIRHYNADIVSLQEVEAEQFYTFFMPELEKESYSGIFAPKSRARTMPESEAKYVDGCAIFWKVSKFSLITKTVIEFNQLAIQNAEGSENIINRVMTKDNIALCAMLETKEDIWDNMLPPPDLVRQPICVSTVHVIWDPDFCDVKLIQSLMLMSEIKNFVESSQRPLRPGSGKTDTTSVPMILCGDFNSLPDSGVVEFLNNGKVSPCHLDFKDIDYEQVLNTFSHTKDNDYLTHAFSLKNAYDESVMEFTNYTYDFKGVIDYVFFTDNHMNPLGVLGQLDKDWFKENKVVGCPHPHVPSDHFSLLVEFELLASSSNRNQVTSRR